jgi:hypothetical protein
MNKKVGLVLSGAALALGILAVPVLAGTDSQTKAQANVVPVNVKSQNIRTVADTPETPVTPETPSTPANPANPANQNNQTGCGSISAEAMQSIHNSSVMQDAMNSGDLGKMKDAMNSPEIKAQLGDDVVNSMNQMMSDANINAMHSTQGVNKTGSGSRSMRNWQ